MRCPPELRAGLGIPYRRSQARSVSALMPVSRTTAFRLKDGVFVLTCTCTPSYLYAALPAGAGSNYKTMTYYALFTRKTNYKCSTSAYQSCSFRPLPHYMQNLYNVSKNGLQELPLSGLWVILNSGPRIANETTPNHLYPGYTQGCPRLPCTGKRSKSNGETIEKRRSLDSSGLVQYFRTVWVVID